MIVSMTGYGRATAEGAWGSLSVEISSVNHRFQEVSVRLPREIASFEPLIEKEARSAFARGKVQLRISLLWAPGFVSGEIREDVLEGYFRSVEKVRNRLHLLEEPRIDALLSLPGVLEGGEGARERAVGEVEPLLLGAVRSALSSWNGMRRTEGAHLQADIVSNLDLFAGYVGRVATSWEGARDAAREAAAGRIRSLVETGGVACDEARLVQELALLAERWDISEEIARAESHVTKFRAMLDEEGAVGRKGDFLIQEMNREVNTMASKISDAEIRWIVVEAKTVLERIREQIQNVE